MIYLLSIPAAIPGVDEIRILEWHKKTGDAIEVDDLIIELETHKAIVEVRAAQAGVLREILAKEGDWRTIGLAVGICSSEADEVLPADTSSAPSLSVQFAVT